MQRHLWVVDLAVVAICAALCGLSVSTMVATRLPPETSRPVTSRSPLVAPERNLVFDKQPDAIVHRNIFCSACPAPISEPTGLVEEATERKTTLPIALVAVMYAPESTTGNLSIAVVQDTDSRLTGAFVLGDRIRDAVVADIRETRVYLDRRGAIEYLDLLDTPEAKEASTSASGARKKRDSIAAELDRGIKKMAEHRYEVQRRTLESLLENVAVLARSARPVPEIREGRMTGFRLFAIHPDGPVARIGIKNGDVIRSVNGLELSGPDKAVEAFGKLRSASHLSLRLDRGGVTLTNDYVIR